MTYEYECSECGERCEADMAMSVIGSEEEPEVLCPACQSVCKRLITGGCGFVLRGSSWPGKASKARRQRADRSKEMELRQFRKHGLDGGHSLVPNVDGEVCPDWKEAKKLADSKGIDDPMYDHMIFRDEAKKEITTKDQVGFKPVTPASGTKEKSKPVEAKT